MVDMPIHVTTEAHTKKTKRNLFNGICFLVFTVGNSLIMIIPPLMSRQNFTG
jgi:hypothetical protein